MARPTSGNFIDYVTSNSGAAATLVGNGSPSTQINGANNSDYLVLDNALAAKGGNGKGGGKPDGGGDTGGGDPVVTSTYTSGDPSVDDSLEFNVTIEFMDDWTGLEHLMDQFIAAADYLSTIIEADMADVTYNGQDIDDIVIQASITDIDGSGGVLGQAGPTVVRTADYTPIMGIMEFDVADAQDFYDIGEMDAIILHEMMHVLGFGTLWDYSNLITQQVDDNGAKRPVDDIITAVYNGTDGNAAYDADPDTFIMVETDGGSGTAYGHWDEETYNYELMTGYIGGTGAGVNYLSDWSVASLSDLGYTMDANASGLDDIVFA